MDAVAQDGLRLDFDRDDGAAALAGFGLIVLATDETLETELRRVFDRRGTGLYHARIPSAADVTVETLGQMEAALPEAAALLPRGLDVVAYACTSGATVIGADRVAALIRRHHPGAAVTDPISAVLAACRHLGLGRIGLVTPYLPEVSARMRAHIAAAGIEIAAFGSFEQVSDAAIARIAEGSIREAACRIGAAPAVEGVFISCTNLRCFDVIEAAEARLAKPVISSNQALAWHMLRLAGQPVAGRGPGRLFAAEADA